MKNITKYSKNIWNLQANKILTLCVLIKWNKEECFETNHFNGRQHQGLWIFVT